MPLDELQRIEIAIELDKGVSHKELVSKFSTSMSELKGIENLFCKKNTISKQKVNHKRGTEKERTLIVQKLMQGELPEKIAEQFESLKTERSIIELYMHMYPFPMVVRKSSFVFRF